MATTLVDQITGFGETVAYKAPCRLATTGNITLSGLQTIDGVVTVADDRVLVRAQSTSSQNGIYIASSGIWQRARDLDSNRDVTKGTRLTVTDGSTLAGKEYQITTANPITVGTSALTFAETLSSDAGSSATAAAASATAAAGSATAAAGSATAAATSATNASTSATNASTSATAAAGSATTASTQAGNASTSATNAATSATNAGNSATAAAGSATTASNAATAAGTSETNAGTSATAAAGSASTAAASASAAANSVAALGYAFSTTTTDADPGSGVFRLNNATVGSATAAYVDNVDADGVTVSAILDSWDDAVATIRGTLVIRSKASAAIRHAFKVTGSVVDGSGYRKLTLSYVGGAGTLTNTMPCWLVFTASGDDGAGDLAGPPTSTDNGYVRWNGTSGDLVKDGATTIPLADLGNGAAVSILGRSANSSGARADIAAGSNDTFLQRVGNALSWGALTIGMIPDALVTFAKLASGALATTTELWSGTASKLVTASIVKDAAAYQTLTDGTNIAWNMANGHRAQVVLGGARTGDNPTNGIPNFGFTLKLTATGSTRTWTPGNQFFPATGVESFPISVTTSATVYVVGFVDTATRFVITGVIRT